MAITVVFFLLLVLDQVSKYWIVQNLALGESRAVLSDFFSLTLLHNSGAAWGFLAEHSWGIHLLSALSLLVTFILLFMLRRLPISALKWVLTVLLAGAVGNLLDRLRLGYVIDFIALRFFGYYDYPAFNLADSCIVCATVALLGLLCFHKPSQKLFDELTSCARKESVDAQ